MKKLLLMFALFLVVFSIPISAVSVDPEPPIPLSVPDQGPDTTPVDYVNELPQHPYIYLTPSRVAPAFQAVTDDVNNMKQDIYENWADGSAANDAKNAEQDEAIQANTDKNAEQDETDEKHLVYIQNAHRKIGMDRQKERRQQKQVDGNSQGVSDLETAVENMAEDVSQNEDDIEYFFSREADYLEKAECKNNGGGGLSLSTVVRWIQKSFMPELRKEFAEKDSYEDLEYEVKWMRAELYLMKQYNRFVTTYEIAEYLCRLHAQQQGKTVKEYGLTCYRDGKVTGDVSVV